MWQAATFDPQTIARELGWAAGLGMNVVRVYLHDLLWESDQEGFLARVDAVLELADGCGIKVLPVLLDGVWHPAPALGAQPAPRPRRHNSIWVQSPGHAVLQAAETWPRLQAYVQGVIRHFAADERVVAWDLFNEPDQLDAHTIAAGSRDAKATAATALLAQVFQWAREVDPSQPLTVGVWEYDADRYPVANQMNQLALSHSDVISFHCYEPKLQLEQVIDGLRTQGRPLLCTEWLARTAGSTVDLLEIFAAHGVGAINWGLVDGRTQTRFPWSSWTESVPQHAPWFHELLHADGTAYDPDEVAVFRRLTRAER